MPTIVANPNPTTPSRIDVSGAGFATGTWISLVLNGSGTTTKFGVQRDGSFKVGVPIPSNLANGSYKLEARQAGTSSVLASVMVVVSKVVVPPPVVDPAPIVSNVKVVPGTTDAIITWDISEKATGWVEYGPTTALGFSSTRELSFNYSSHQQTITGLVAGSPYYFRVTGNDTVGQPYASAVTQFSTLASPIIVPPVVIPPSSYNAEFTSTNGDDTLALKAFIESHRNQKVRLNGVIKMGHHGWAGQGWTLAQTPGSHTVVDFAPGAKLLLAYGDVWSWTPGILGLFNCWDITINDLRVEGSAYYFAKDSENGGLGNKQAETEAGITIMGGGNIILNRPETWNTRGDGIYQGVDSGVYPTASVGVVVNQPWLHHNSRMGIVPNAGQLTVNGGTIEHSGGHNIDMEPNQDYDAGTIDFTMSGSTMRYHGELGIGDFGANPMTTWMLGACGYSKALKKNIDIQNCTADIWSMNLSNTKRLRLIGNTSLTPISCRGQAPWCGTFNTGDTIISGNVGIDPWINGYDNCA